MNELLETEKKTNTAFVQGEIVTEPEITYSRNDEKFYEFDLKVNRQSDKCDILKVTASSRVFEPMLGEKFITLSGEVRTRNYRDAETGKDHLAIYLFAKECYFNKDEKNENDITLIGFVCKPPKYRITPKNRREICDFTLAVNRQNGKRSDYIPSIAWGRDATFVSNLPVGTCLEATGRLQSREYDKIIGEETVKKVAYEFSISNVKIIDDKDEFTMEVL